MNRRLNHRWTVHYRDRFKTERVCIHGCGMVKVTRHEFEKHWTEFWRKGQRIEGDATPPCERGEPA